MLSPSDSGARKWLGMISEKRRALENGTAEVNTSERGASMLGILLVVVILGVLVVITLSSNFGTTPTTLPAVPGVTTTTAPTSPASGANEARVGGCEANYASIEQAISTYRALNGGNPPAGTSWALSSANGGPFFQSWPTDVSYSITWSGSTLSVIPVHGRAARGSYGSSSPASGCFGT